MANVWMYWHQLRGLALSNFAIRDEKYLQDKVERWWRTITQAKLQTYMEGSRRNKHEQHISTNAMETQKIELKKQFKILRTETNQHAGKVQPSQDKNFGIFRSSNAREGEELYFLGRFNRPVQGSQKLKRENRIWIEMKEDAGARSIDVVPSLKKRSLAKGAAKLDTGHPQPRKSPPKTRESQRNLGETRPKSSPKPKTSPRPNSSEARPNSRESHPKAGQSSSNSSLASKVKHGIQFLTGPVAKATQKTASPVLKTSNSLKTRSRKSVRFEDTPKNGLTSGYAPKPPNAEVIQTLDCPEQNTHVEKLYAPAQEELDLLNQQRSPPKCFETRAHFDFINSHSKNWEEWSYREDQNFAQTHGNPPPLDPNQTQQNGPKGYRAFALKPPSPRTNTLNAQQLSQQLVLGKEKEDIQNFITKNRDGFAKFHKSPPREENTQMPPEATHTVKKPPAKAPANSSSAASSDDESPPESRNTSPNQSICQPVRLLINVASSNQLPSAKHLRTPPIPQLQPQMKNLSNRKINEVYGGLVNRVRSSDKLGQMSYDQNETPAARDGIVLNVS